jgi:hypothetical protein
MVGEETMIKRYSSKVKPLAQCGLDQIDGGCFASVFESDTDANSKYVVKVGSSRGDPYLSFAKHVVKMRKPNKFLPRIKKIFIVDDEYYVVLERLKKLDPLCNDADFIHVNSISNANLFMKEITNLLEIKHRDNKELMRAIKIVARLKKAHRATWDLHSANVMLRGRQLVITDPLC